MDGTYGRWRSHRHSVNQHSIYVNARCDLDRRVYGTENQLSIYLRLICVRVRRLWNTSRMRYWQSHLSQPLICHEANDSAGVSEPQPSREIISHLYTYRPLQVTDVLRRSATRPYYD